MAKDLLVQGSGVAVDMGQACLRFSLDLMGAAHLGHDFKVIKEWKRNLLWSELSITMAVDTVVNGILISTLD